MSPGNPLRREGRRALTVEEITTRTEALREALESGGACLEPRAAERRPSTMPAPNPMRRMTTPMAMSTRVPESMGPI